MRSELFFCPFLSLALTPGVFAGQAANRTEVRSLSRSEAIRLGLAHNLGYQADNLEQQRTAALLEAAFVPFSPALSLSIAYEDDTASDPDDTRLRRLPTELGLTWSTPIGSDLGLGFSTDQTLTSAGDDDNEVSLWLTASQHLLRGGFRAGAGASLALAELEDQLGREVLRQALQSLLVRVDEAYWLLALSQAELEIKTRSRDRARKQFEDTRAHIRRGTLAEVEIYVVEENLVFFEQELLRVAEELALSTRRLAILLHQKPDTALRAADRLEPSSAPLEPRETLIARGLAGSPALRVLRLVVREAEVARDRARNERLPAIDLQASFALRGLDPEIGTSYNDMVVGRRPEGRIGLFFSIPLDLAPSRAALTAAETALLKRQVELSQGEEHLRFDVADLVTQIEAQQERLKLFERRVKLAELKLDAEVEKVGSGVSTLAEVVRIQRELDETSQSLRRAQVGLIVRQNLLRATIGDLDALQD